MYRSIAIPEQYTYHHELARDTDEILSNSIAVGEETSHMRFRSHEAAVDHIKRIMIPQLSWISSDVLLQASGDGVRLLDIKLDPNSEHSLAVVPQDTRPLNLTEPVARGHFKRYTLRPYETDEGWSAYAIDASLLLKSPKVIEAAIHEQAEVTIQPYIKVNLDGSARISPSRIQELQDIDGALQTHMNLGNHSKLVYALSKVDRELARVRPDKFQAVQDIRALRYAGHIAMHMLREAGDNHLQRRAVLDVLRIGTPLVGQEIIFGCDGPVTGKVMAKDSSELPEWISLGFDDDTKARGKLMGIVEYDQSADLKSRPVNVPHFVVQITGQGNKTDYLCFAPMPRINHLAV